MHFTLDRFEENFALLESEDRTMLRVERILLPEDAKEGDVFLRTEGGFVPAKGVQEERAARIRDKMKGLWK